MGTSAKGVIKHRNQQDINNYHNEIKVIDNNLHMEGSGSDSSIQKYNDYKATRKAKNKNNAWKTNNNNWSYDKQQQWSNKKNKGSGAWKQQPEWRKADATSDNEGIVMDGETKIAMDEKVTPSEKEKPKLEDEEKAIGKEGPKISYDSKVIPPEEDSEERVAFPSYHDKSKRIWKIEKKARANFPELKKKHWQQEKNWKNPIWDGHLNLPQTNWNDNSNNSLRKNTGWNNYKAKQAFENQNGQGKNEVMRKELLQKKLEDEALQKLRDLDRKILKLQAESLKEKEEKNKMKRKGAVSDDDDVAKHGFIGWFHRVVHALVSLLGDND